MRRSPRRDVALAYLHSLVSGTSPDSPARLPTIAVLARKAGVAPATMWSAVRQLCREGVLVARPRSGVHIARDPFGDRPRPPGDSSGQLPSAAQRWEHVRDRIEEDIAGGVFFSEGILPRSKQLLIRYGVCHQTLRKALASLEQGGALVRRSKSWHIVGNAPRTTSSTVLFIEWVSGQAVVNALDTECSRMGLRLQIVRLFPRERLFETLAQLRAGSGDKPVVGVLLAITGGSPAQYREILTAITPFERPIAILDQTGGATGVSLPGGRAVRVVTIAANREPGRLMGRFLLNNGHRRAAFISAVHHENWSRARYAGMEEVFRRVPGARLVEVFDERGRSPQAHSTQVAADLFWLTEKLLSRERPRHRRLARCLRRMSTELSAAMAWAYVEEGLGPLMERALAMPGVSAWVAANDPMALACTEFLRSRGVRVPEDMSVAGFDDSLAAFTADLTSYNFNRTAAVRAAVSYLVSGPARGGASGPRTVEIDGFVTPRGSTRNLATAT